MLKYLINLLATATSFVILLLVATSATALPQSELSKDFVASQLQWVSLNVISPELKIATEAHTSFSHLGCTCAVCTQAIAPQFKL